MPAPGPPQWSRRVGCAAASVTLGVGGLPAAQFMRAVVLSSINAGCRVRQRLFAALRRSVLPKLLGCLRDDLAGDPAIEIGERALRDGVLLRDGLRRATQALAIRPLVGHARKRRKQSEID